MALRRLARYVLHRAAPVPTPPTPLGPFPAELRSCILLRFFTLSSDPPHFMVDYLVSTCGLSPAKAAKTAPRFAHLSSADRPDAVLAFLRSQGLTRAQVRAVVSRYPRLLLSKVDATIAPKFRAVRSVGLTGAEAARLFALFPTAFTWGVHTKLLPRLQFWLHLLGSTRLLMKCLAKTWSWLFNCSVDVLKDNMSRLRGNGVLEAQLVAAVRQKPFLIMQPPASLRALAARVDACRVPRGTSMYAWALLTLLRVRDVAFRAKMVAVTRATGCTEQDFLAMFRRAPRFVSMSAELLRRKVEFLIGSTGCGADDIQPQHVDGAAVPCHRGLEGQRRGHRQRATGDHLEKAGGQVYGKVSHQAPELLDLYPPNHRKGSLGDDTSTIGSIGSSSQSEDD